MTRRFPISSRTATAGQSQAPKDSPQVNPVADDVNPYIIQVPMKVDAYLNYGRTLGVSTPNEQRAYLAPITQPDFRGLQMQSDLIQHDIFEDVRDCPYLSSADPDRQRDSRRGVYLHWSLPKLYRSGIVGSETASDLVEQLKLQGGFPTTNPGDHGSGPTFRPIPTRWVVWRSIRGLTIPPVETKLPQFLSPKLQMQGMINDQYKGWPPGSLNGDANTIHNCFVINSDSVRDVLSVTDPTEDVEVTASPYLDLSQNSIQKNQSFLGRAFKLEDWPADGPNPPAPMQITVAQPYNPFFADYQPQNSSVLSFFDDLSWEDVYSSIWNFTEASISYTVMGYHVTNDDDPLYVKISAGQTIANRLLACNLQVDPLSSTLDDYWPGNMRTLCYGSIFNLIWQRPPQSGTNNMLYPADTLQQSFLKDHPVTVGTNTLDALFAWLRSTNTGNGLTTDEIRRNLMKLQTLILDINDDVDSQLQAEDLLATNNFVPGPSETYWHFKAPDLVPDNTQPTIPTDDQAKKLRALNAAQAQLNALQREYDCCRAQLWATFWTYMADRSKGTQDQQDQRRRNAILAITDSRNQISTDLSGSGISINSLTAAVKQLQEDLGGLQAGTKSTFYTQRDPTLMIAGLKSQWPSDWDQGTTVRLNPAAKISISAGPVWPPISTSVFDNKIPSTLLQPMTDVICEGVYSYQGYHAFQAQSPYFDDQDRYTGSQGWFPLFVEWEVEYYHIPFELWEFGPQGPEARVGYSLSSAANIATADIQGDFRILSGRCPLLPQTGAILESTLKQVFSKINPDDQLGPNGKDPMTAAEKVELLNAARTLDFSATLMSGLTDQITTQMQGSHVTPLMMTSNGLDVVSDASGIGTEIGLTKEDFLAMQGQMAVTPFASLVDIPADPTKYSPFKPCIHGQFRFTKLNIVDKFGQVIRGVQEMSDVLQSIGPTPTPLFPCLGESYSVEVNSDNVTAKIVLPRTDGLCNFVQLPPSINQNTRVNAAFVSQDTPTLWRQLDEWENPVKGWIVINKANSSMQVFSPDGNFVREFAVTNGAPITRPFAADDNLVNGLDPVMQSLLSKFAVPGWIVGFFGTLARTVEEVQANPSSFSESMLSVLGRPLAVTTFGVSLELANPPMVNQSTLAPIDPSIEPANLLNYKFGYKIGDKNNVFDGLYGIFTAAPTVDPVKGAQINWNSFYSYHTPDPAVTSQVPGDPSRAMVVDLTLQPFYPNPHATNWSLELSQKQQVFVGIIDPFTPLNIYTALLPICQLRLPPWTIENGVSKISTFFKLGPVLIPGDVTPFNADPAYIVARDYRLGDAANEPLQNGSIPVPAVGLGDWAWLQPYWDQEGGATKYNLAGVDPAVGKPDFKPVPYTAVEGYLQQKRPFEKPEPMNS